MNEDKKKYPERSDIIIRKAIHDALFTRKKPVPAVKSPPEVPEPNPMLKRFAPVKPVTPAPVIPAIQPRVTKITGGKSDTMSTETEQTPPTEWEILPAPSQKPPEKPVVIPDIDPQLTAIIEADIIEQKKQADMAARAAPLPPLVMVPKRGFWATLKSKISLPLTSKVRRKQKEITTGLTNHQRIKRYNSLHEGGHNAPIPEVTTDTVG